MEDWRASIGKILSNAAVNLEHGFHYTMPPPQASTEYSAVRTKGPLPKVHKHVDHKHVEYVSTHDSISDVQPPTQTVPMGVLDAVLTKIVEKVESLRESVKGVHVELNAERNKREMKERELYLNLKAEVNERIAQVLGDWRKSESALRRHILELEEKVLMVPLNNQRGTQIAPVGDGSASYVDMQDKMHEKLFDLEAELNRTKRGFEDRRRQDSEAMERVQEEVQRATESIKGVAREAGAESAAQEWRVRSTNMEAMIEQRLHKFQELHSSNSAIVMELGSKLARLGEQVSMDVSAHRETMKRDLDGVMEQQFLLRDWKDGMENKLKLTNDNFDKRVAKIQTEIMASVNAFKQQMLEDEKQIERGLEQELGRQSEAVMERAQVAVQSALKQLSVASNNDYAKAQKQITGIKNSVDEIHAQCNTRLREAEKRIEETASDVIGHTQRMAHLSDKTSQLSETASSCLEEAKKTKKECKALRQELAEGSSSMEKLGSDVEARLKDFSKSLKEQAVQTKVTHTTVKECKLQITTALESHQNKVDRLQDELDRAGTQLKYLTEGQEEARLRLDRGDRRVDSISNSTMELKAGYEEARAKLTRTDAVMEDHKNLLTQLQQRPIGVTQVEVMQTLKESKSELKDFVQQTLQYQSVQTTSKIHADLHQELQAEIKVIVEDLAAQRQDSKKLSDGLQADVVAIANDVRGIHKKIEATCEEQGRTASAESELRGFVVELQDSSRDVQEQLRSKSIVLRKMEQGMDRLQVAVKALEARPTGDVLQKDLEILNQRHQKAVAELDRKMVSLQQDAHEERISEEKRRATAEVQREAEIERHKTETMAQLTAQERRQEAYTLQLIEPVRETLRLQEGKIIDAQRCVDSMRLAHSTTADTLQQCEKSLDDTQRDVESLQSSCREIAALRTTQQQHSDDLQAVCRDIASVKTSQQQHGDDLQAVCRDIASVKMSQQQHGDDLQAVCRDVGSLKVSMRQNADQCTTASREASALKTALQTNADEMQLIVRDLGALKQGVQQVSEDLQSSARDAGSAKQSLQQMTQEVASCIRENAAAKNRLQQMEDEVQSLHSKCKEATTLKTDVHNFVEDLQSVQSKCKETYALKTDMQQFTQDLQSFQSKCKEANALKVDVQRIADDLQSVQLKWKENYALKEDVQQLGEELSVVSRDISSAKVVAQQLTEEVQSVQARCKEANSLKADLQQLGEELLVTSRDLGSAKVVTQQLADDVESLRSKCKEVSSVKGDVQQLAEEVQSLQSKCRDVAALKADVHQLEEEISGVSRDVNSSKAAAQQLAEDSQSKAKDSSWLRANMQQLEELLQSGPAAASRESGDLSQHQQSQDLEVLTSSVGKCNKRISEIQSQFLEQQSSTMAAMRTMNEDWESQYSALRITSERVTQEIESFKADMASQVRLSQRRFEENTGLTESLRSSCERRLADHDLLLDGVRGACEAGARAVTACKEENAHQLVMVEKKLNDMNGQLQTLAGASETAGQFLKNLKAEQEYQVTKCKEQFTQLQSTCEFMSKNFDELCSAQKATSAAAGDASEKLNRRVGLMESQFSLHCQESEVGVRNTTERFSEQKEDMTKIHETQDLLLLNLKKSDNEWSQKLADVQAVLQEYHQEMSKREEALAKSFETRLGQTSERMHGLIQSLNGMAERIDDQNQQHQQLHKQLQEQLHQLDQLAQQQDEQQHKLEEELQQQQELHEKTQQQLQQQVAIQEQLQEQELKQQLCQQLQQLEHWQQRMQAIESGVHTTQTAEQDKISELENCLKDHIQSLADRIAGLESTAPPLPAQAQGSPVTQQPLTLVKLEEELGETRQTVDGIQQDLQETMDNVVQLNAKVDVCLDGNADVGALREQANHLQDQTEKVLNWKMKRITSDIAMLKRAYESFRQDFRQTQGLQRELQLLTRTMRQMQPVASDDDSLIVASESSTDPYASVGRDRRQLSDSFLPETMRSDPQGDLVERRQTAQLQMLPVSPRTADLVASAGPSRAPMEVVSFGPDAGTQLVPCETQCWGLTEIGGPEAEVQAAAAEAEEDQRTSDLIRKNQEDLQALRREIEAQNQLLGTAVEMPVVVRDEAGPHVTWAEPLCDADAESSISFIEAASGLQPDLSQSEDGIAELRQELYSLKVNLAQTQSQTGEPVASDEVDASLQPLVVSPAGPCLSGAPPEVAGAVVPYASDGDSSSDLGASDRLISSVQSDLSSLAGLLAGTYGKIGQREHLTHGGI